MSGEAEDYITESHSLSVKMTRELNEQMRNDAHTREAVETVLKKLLASAAQTWPNSGLRFTAEPFQYSETVLHDVTEES